MEKYEPLLDEAAAPLALTAEQRETLASIVHDLREHSDAIHKGIEF